MNSPRPDSHSFLPPTLSTAQAVLRVGEALADRLSRLTVSGRLRPCDPEFAAEQFLALITGPLEVRSRLGTRTIGPAELRELADAAVDTFLHAYGAETPAAD
ncbi:TetR/AcrR family transcriptional regulator C-terminal domain-containing protein [Streptomyces sp. BH097]|uniref:TetR/AcrR family transcriptional regulator C-terminal domain-containing protein n=1 Tax=unclassified Streptomyces TaxID=2593676 RepID=UPI003BB78585